MKACLYSPAYSVRQGNLAMVRIRLRLASLSPGFIAMMVGPCFIDIASAQQSQDDEYLEEVVIGVRRSLQQSPERQRQGSAVIDAISTQDNG